MDRYGDLGSTWEAAPRHIFVWEGLLAHLPAHKQTAERSWVKYKRWQRAYRLWEWDETLRHVVHDATWRLHRTTDVLVTHPEPFAQLVRDFMDETGYEYSQFINCSLEELDKRLPYWPEVERVWHGEAARPFLFGARGRVYVNPGQVVANG